VLSRKGVGRDRHDGRSRNGNGVRLRSEQLLPNKSSRFSVVGSAVGSLGLEHCTPADMDDGQPLPAPIEDGIVRDEVVAGSNPTTPTKSFPCSSVCCDPPAKTRRGLPGQLSGQKRRPRHESPLPDKMRSPVAVGTATGAKNKSKSQSQRNNRKAENSEQEARRRNGNAATCANCGAPLSPRPGSRRQRYCGDACRQIAFRAKKWASRYERPDPLRSTRNNRAISTPYKADSGDRPPAVIEGRGIAGPPKVIAVEVFGGREWHRTTSPDGVVCEVARLSASHALRWGVR
jgi:hypothetical protein